MSCILLVAFAPALTIWAHLERWAHSFGPPDIGTRLREIANSTGSSLLPRHLYAYDPLNRRTRATLEDGSAWAWDFNDRNEVTAGRRLWADQAVVAGQQFEYGFDDIGNRKMTKQGGDQSGSSLRLATYSPNTLNQYTSRSVPAAADVVGLANAGATVSVNGLPASGAGSISGKNFP